MFDFCIRGKTGIFSRWLLDTNGDEWIGKSSNEVRRLVKGIES